MTHQGWMFPLIRLMPCLLQSLQGFYVWLLPILIFLDCSFLLAWKVINYDARVEHYLYCYNRWITCRPLSYFIIFQSSSRIWIPGFFAIWYHHSNLLDFQSGIGAVAHATFKTQHLLSYQSCSCWYNYLSTMFWWRSICNFWSVWITRVNEILDSPVFKKVDNTANILAYLFKSASKHCFLMMFMICSS